MIDERGLLSAMKSTWRSEGYTVAGYREDGERVLCHPRGVVAGGHSVQRHQPEGTGAAGGASGRDPGRCGVDGAQGRRRTGPDHGRGADPAGRPAAAH